MHSDYHIPVLRQTVLSYLTSSSGGLFVDATVGGGGHAEAILDANSKSRLIGIDADDEAIEYSRNRLFRFGSRVVIEKGNFQNIKEIVDREGKEKPAGILFDLGVSSFQLDEPSKGFSFRSDSRLDMRMDRTQERDAHFIINTYDERELKTIFKEYGEERASRTIARRIVQRRERRPIETTGDLAALIEEIVGGRFLTKSLARIFQALRIEVNNELECLRHAVHDSIDLLCPGGRVVVISYHSLEDRIVKQALKELSATHIPSGSKIVPDTVIDPTIKVLTKKPVVPDKTEYRSNPRARSAKLRAAEKIDRA
jgi:16S rRNA (cytosine1402-N4)-methyltransferase